MLSVCQPYVHMGIFFFFLQTSVAIKLTICFPELLLEEAVSETRSPNGVLTLERAGV